jgi:hypothetical protein
MFSGWLGFRYKNRLGYAAGALIGILCLLLLLADNYADWHSPGLANSGHEKLKCSDCHRLAPGSVRQQIQANLK